MSMNWLKRHDIAVFLILAFALSWWLWPFVLSNPESTPMLPYGCADYLPGSTFRWLVRARSASAG